MLSELAFPHIRCCLSAIPSDLMKSTAVDESLSSMNQQFCSRENQLLQMLQQNEKSTQILDIAVSKWVDNTSLIVPYLLNSTSMKSHKVLASQFTFIHKVNASIPPCEACLYSHINWSLPKPDQKSSLGLNLCEGCQDQAKGWVQFLCTEVTYAGVCWCLLGTKVLLGY